MPHGSGPAIRLVLVHAKARQRYLICFVMFIVGIGLVVLGHVAGLIREVFQGGSGATNGQTIAILAIGSVWVWGDNKEGQLGDGSRTHSDVQVPVDVPAGLAFVKVNTGGYSCYAIDNSGRLWAWAATNSGQLGTGIGVRIETGRST